MSSTIPCILVVDDDEHLRITLGDFLEFHGFRVLQARSGEAALLTLREQVVDLMLLDIMLPGRDGGEVAQTVLANPKWAGIPIVYLTAAVTRQEVLSHHGIIGGQPIIAKPIELDELLARIHAVLGSIPAGSAAPSPDSPQKL